MFWVIKLLLTVNDISNTLILNTGTSYFEIIQPAHQEGIDNLFTQNALLGNISDYYLPISGTGYIGEYIHWGYSGGNGIFF